MCACDLEGTRKRKNCKHKKEKKKKMQVEEKVCRELTLGGFLKPDPSLGGRAALCEMCDVPLAQREEAKFQVSLVFVLCI